MDVLTEDVRDGSLMELLIAGDLVLCGESLNEVMDEYGRWKNAVEGKDLRVKPKVSNYYLGRKLMLRMGILVLSVVSGLVAMLFIVRNVRGGFMVGVLMCLRR